MPEILTKPNIDSDADSYEFTPYGLLLIKLGSDDLARRACDALELHLRKFNLVLTVDENRLTFMELT